MTAPASTSCPDLADLDHFVEYGESDEAIRHHVESCPDCRKRLQEIRDNNDLLSRISTTSTDPDDRGPDVTGEIAGYELLSEVHRGGQGIVYEARQLATKRTVAVKVLLSGALAAPAQQRRFEREVDLVAQLRHPNIVTVYDSGVTAEGRHWFAMEFVSGRTLDEVIGPGDATPRLSPRDALALMRDICGAVAYAHQRGIIHRDLKPGNILVDDSGTPRVVDFGLARPIDPACEEATRTVTVAGGFVGTLAYAAPEQTRGDATLVDVRSDVYALGVVLYELLTGHPPYPVTGSLSDVLAAITEQPPRPMRRMDAKRYPVDDELETIVLKALAKDPERRYQSADDLRRDLDNYLLGAPIDAKRDSGWYVLKKSVIRHRLAVSVAALFIVMLVGFSVGMFVLYQDARDEADKVSSINIFLEDTLGSVEPRPGEREVTVRAMLDEGVHWVNLVLSDQPEVEAAVRQIIGNGYRNIDQFEQAATQLEAALAIRREQFGPDAPEVAKSLSGLGYLRMGQGRVAEAEQLFEEAFRIRRAAYGDDHLEVAMSLGHLSRAREAAGDLANAEFLQRQLYDIRRSQLGDLHSDTAMSVFNLARLRERRDDPEDALRLHEQALSARRAILHREHPDLARSLLAVGQLEQRLGRPTDAEPRLREAVALRRDALPGGHWQIAAAQVALASCLLDIGQRDEAETLLRASIGVLASERGDDAPETAEAARLLKACAGAGSG